MSMPAPQLNQHERGPSGRQQGLGTPLLRCVPLLGRQPSSNARGCPFESTPAFPFSLLSEDHPIRILKSVVVNEDKRSFLFAFFNNKEVLETAEPRAHLELSLPVDLSLLFRFPAQFPTGKRPRAQIPGWLVWTMTRWDSPATFLPVSQPDSISAFPCLNF